MPLRDRVEPGAGHSDAVIAEMGALRGRAAPLKPELDRTAEADRFVATVRSATHVARAYDHTGALVVMGVMRRSVVEIPRVGDVAELDAAYLAAERTVRGGLGVLASVSLGLLRTLLRPEHDAPGPPVRPRRGGPPPPSVLTGVAYPGSVMLLGELGRVTLWGDAAPPAEAALLERVRASHAERWDPVRECVITRMIAPAPTPGWYARAARNPLYQRFVARCPYWAEGYGLPVAIRLDPLTVARGMLRQAARRWWAGRSRAVAAQRA